MNEAAYRAAEERFWGAYRLRPGERFVRLAATGTRVRVLEVGEGDPVLFIHGGPNAGSTWAPMVAHLTGFRCLMVDRPGTGLSEPYRLTAAGLPAFGARFVSEVLDGLELDRAHVVASSIGGHIALRSAARTPERFLRMVQMAAPALVPGERLPAFMTGLANPVVRWIAASAPPSRRQSESVLRQIGHGASIDAGRLPEPMNDWYQALMRFTDTRRQDFATIASILNDLDVARLRQRDFEAVPVPTRFLWGADDTFAGEAVARRLVAWMHDARLTMIPESGHLPWIDFPEARAADVADVLAPRAVVPRSATVAERVAGRQP